MKKAIVFKVCKKIIGEFDLSDIALTVENRLKPLIEEMGYEVVDVEYVKKTGVFNLTVFIDISAGVSLDDCERVHREVDPILDELDPTNGEPYVLNVSSPGLDRPFKKQRDFERNYGREIEIKLYAPMRGKKVLEGVLISHTQNVTTISVDGTDTAIENNKIAKVCPLVKFE